MSRPGLEGKVWRRVALALGLSAWAAAVHPGEPPGESPAGFAWTDLNSRSLQLSERGRPVLVYNHGMLARPGASTNRFRSTYVHPLYGLDGEVLTDDFPEDHYHHRGLFWAWPHVGVGGAQYDLWLVSGIEQRFENWLAKDATASGAVLGVHNGWYAGDRKVMDERVWIRIQPASAHARAIDLDFTWVPTGQAVTLSGAEGKSYGGLTLRFAPRTNTVITTPLGNASEDLYMTRLPWADLSARFGPEQRPAGAAVFIADDHPGYPPTWLTRHYGVLCVGWPGVEPRTFRDGDPIRARYRVWVHRGWGNARELEEAYRAFTAPTNRAAPAADPVKAPAAALPVRAESRPDRVAVYVGENLFTEYQFPGDTKTPFFHPVNGPGTGRSVTVRGAEPYPHHSSLFFGCDRVNGGNYWQEGLDRGRIVSRGVRIIRASGPCVELEQECRWERSGAEPPLADHRRIIIAAPSADRRTIDFEITLTALTDVVIEKSNHSLFAARVAPELSVDGGGVLINSRGGCGEAGTFGQPAEWADYRGTRAGRTEGLAILNHPANRWSPPPWFTRNYGFFSPTPMNWIPDGDNGVRMAAGDSLNLRYRVVVHADNPEASQLAAAYQAWIREGSVAESDAVR